MNRVVGIILLILVTFNAQAFAEKHGRISGRVVDSSDNTPIFCANIVILDERIGGVTLKDGSYLLTGIPVGMCTVKALFDGYESQTIDSVIVIGANETIVDFQLNYTDSIPIFDCIHGNEGKCEIHGEELITMIRLLKYPLQPDLKYLRGEDAALYEQAHENIFPNSDLDCRPVIPEKGRIIKLYVCPKCIEAREAWLEEHDDIRVLIDKRRVYR